MKTTRIFEFPFVADKPTINGHIYPREELKKAIENRQQAIAERRMFGELNSTENRPRLSRISHIVSELKLEGDRVLATIETLPTEAGEVLAELMQSDEPLQLYPIGYGDCNNDTMIITGFSIPVIHVNNKIEPAEPTDQ